MYNNNNNIIFFSNQLDYPLDYKLTNLNQKTNS